MLSGGPLPFVQLAGRAAIPTFGDCIARDRIMLNFLVWAAAFLGSLAVMTLSVWEWHDAGDVATGVTAGFLSLLVGAVAAAAYYGGRHDRRWWPVVYLGMAAMVATLAGEYSAVPVERITIFSPTENTVELCRRDHHGTLSCDVPDNR